MPRAQVKKIVIQAGKKPKEKPRGDGGKNESFQAHKFKSGAEWNGNHLGRPKGSGSTKISDAYVAALAQEADDDVKEQLGFNKDAKLTYADAIALQTVRQAIQPMRSLVHHESIIELRETTEGKTPEKSEVSGAGGVPLAGMPMLSVNFVDPKDHEGVTFAKSYPDDKRPVGFAQPTKSTKQEEVKPAAADPEQAVDLAAYGIEEE